jgi:hypothetical protein
LELMWKAFPVKRDLRFSQRWLWIWLSAASILRFYHDKKAAGSSKPSVPTYQTIRHPFMKST